MNPRQNPVIIVTQYQDEPGKPSLSLARKHFAIYFCLIFLVFPFDLFKRKNISNSICHKTRKKILFDSFRKI